MTFSANYGSVLKKYEKTLKEIKTDILNMSSLKGGFPAFMFWMNFFNIDILETLLTPHS